MSASSLIELKGMRFLITEQPNERTLPEYIQVRTQPAKKKKMKKKKKAEQQKAE
jgi:hypothetical protein